MVKKLDIIAATIGIALGILIVILSMHYHFNREHTGFAILFPSIIYLVFRNKLINTLQKLDFDVPNNKPIFISLTIAFVFLFMLSLFLSRTEVYHRPLSYFIVVTIVSAIIVTQILVLEEKKNIWLWIILFEVFLLSINIRSCIYFNFAGLQGSDTWWHCDLARQIGQFGHISPLGREYSMIPVMHLEVAMTKIISGLNAKNSFFIISIIGTFSTIFVFLIGKHLFNTKIGLLSMLILNISNYHILWGINIIAMTQGAVFFAIIAFLILNKSKTESNRIVWSIFLILFLIMITLTHTVATFVTFVALLSIFVAIKFYPFLKTVKTNITKYNEINVTLTIILFFGIFVITYWMFVFPHPGASFFDKVVLSAREALASADVGKVDHVTLASVEEPLEVFLKELGYDILIALTVFGICTSFKNNSPSKFAVIICSIVMFAFIYLTALAGTNAILPYRWFIFIYTLVCIIASLGIFALAGLVKSKSKKVFSALFIVSLLTFFMITGGYANIDSPIYTKSERLGFLTSELEAASFLSKKHNDTTIYTDFTYHGWFSNPKSFINPEWSYANSSGMIVLRRYNIEELKVFKVPYRGIRRSVGINASFIKNFKNNSLVYENGQVKAYV